MVNIQPLCPAALDALVPVSIHRLAPALPPFTDIGSSRAAAPMMAALALVRKRDGLATALGAARHATIGLCDYELRPANRAQTLFLPDAAPSADAVTIRRTISGRSMPDLLSGAVERLGAYLAQSFLSVLLPIERFARLALVPRNEHAMSLAALSRAIPAAAEATGNGRATAFAGMGFRSHLVSIAQYAAMARKRIDGDCPMFSTLEAAE